MRLAERWSAKAKRYENAPVGAFSAEGPALHRRVDSPVAQAFKDFLACEGAAQVAQIVPLGRPEPALALG